MATRSSNTNMDYFAVKSCSPSTKEVVLQLLDDFENLSKELIDNIAAVASMRGQKSDLSQSVSKTVERLIEKDKEIQTAVKTGAAQLVVQHQIAQIKEETAKKDQEILQLQSELRDAEQILANALFEAKKKLKATRQANDAAISSENLIKFAFRISSSNAVEAPPDWQHGDPRRPYPLDFLMRRGVLGQISQSVGGDYSSGDDLAMQRSSAITEEKPMQTNIGDAQTNRNSTGQFAKSGAWPIQPQGSDVYPQILESKEQPYAMVSADAVQPQNIFNGGQGPTNADDVEFMSSSSDSSSSDSH